MQKQKDYPTGNGASTIAGGQGERMPSNSELEGAKFQDRYVAQLAERLAGIKIG